MMNEATRQMAKDLLKEACEQGAGKQKSCEIIGISIRTFQRWESKSSTIDQRTVVIKTPVNRLTEEERQEILNVCNEERFSSLPPKQIVPILADEGRYIASERSFYRVLKTAEQSNHRGKSAASKTQKPAPYEADAPNQLWSWDITYLATTVKGVFFYLYLFMDIYSRKIVGWEVYEQESSEQAAGVLRKARWSESIPSGQEIILHSDNGSPMKGATMLATMQKLGVVPSFSRPSVSNDNAYSEALFKTLKYTPAYPGKPFNSLQEAREWVQTFVHWYNHQHRHGGINYVTPHQRHQREDITLLKSRDRVYQLARERKPERWSGETRNWTPVGVVKLNPQHETKQKTIDKKAA